MCSVLVMAGFGQKGTAMNIKAPSGKQCNNHEKVYEDENQVGYAIWYPQMGGYVGKAVALFDKEWEDRGTSAVGGCIDVLVWHDGEFPFGDDEDEPRRIHHCDPEQFVVFGQKLAELNEIGRKVV